MEEAIGRLKTYKERIKYKKGKQVDNQEKLMFTRHESKGKYFRGCGRGKHRFSKEKSHEKFKEERKDGEYSHMNFNRNNFKKSSYDTSKLQCYQCKKIWHIAPNCPQRTKANKQSNHVKEDLEPTLLMAILEDSYEGNQVKKVKEQKVSLHEEDVGAPFPKKAKAGSTSPLDLVYGDLCGPITPPTPSGKKCIFLLVDDYTRYMWVYFLSTKDQAFDTFKEYKKTIENELRTTLKMLRTDRGGEFTSNEFTKYCKDNAEDEPKNYKEALSNQKWIEAMKVKLDSINRNNTCELTTLPKGHKAIGLKWVFKTKKDANGNIIKHKARLVAKGYIQEHGIDFEEVFAPVARMETIRLLLAISANNKWEVHHLDVKSAFLHGELKEEVYVTQPEGFMKREDNGKIYRLIKALYGLRQAPHDLIITGTPKKEIDKFKAQMKEKIEMSDLGLLAYYLGIEVTQTGGDISIKESAYANKILKEAGMIDCNETLIPMDPGTRLTKLTEGTMVNSTEYRILIGCLDICFTQDPA
nr:ribonuclease H-like domain, reverse transcriptase, RNA-dependent DNA polymerase [Tanacetum cinerariifolium]